ncbi:hypothetical protein BMT55_00095 [Listeria newyorkensis]|uniref:HTH cro/C1-type domain-containing protein n=1 Tax=Listeria newyorkensis TaxID=1497681 RepID=A0ABX4XRZ3_9LIST|nr:helix-turn-helix transcriptional regulator [Listeria newyorkensis]PNP94791.1 hypothetical protein BMT55_00095 [Listeria newyorkensis]
MKSFGDTIREIRLNKNIQQSKMSSVKQSSLANIEKGRIPSVEIFMDILQELDINVLEFFYIQNNFKLVERDHLFKLFREQKQSLNEPFLLSLIAKYDEYLSSANDPFAESLRHVLSISVEINRQQTFDIDSPKAKEIWDKISSQEVWYHNDIYLITKIFYTFPIEQAENVIIRANKELKKYEDYPQIHLFKISFLLNCARLYILSGVPLKSKTHLIEAERLARLHQVEISRITAHHLLAYSEYLEGYHEEAQQRVNRTTKVLHALEALNEFTPLDEDALNYNKIVADHSKEWNKFLAKQNSI